MADHPPDSVRPDDAAVLVSGGVDSAVLCVDLARAYRCVFPIFLRSGLRWEEVELASLRNFLSQQESGAIAPLTVLEEPIADVYEGHWSVSSPHAVPDASSPDEAVYLPGRNLLLLTKAAIWCHLRGIETLALGILASNPFPDATPEFFGRFERLVELATGGRLRVVRPYENLTKREVLGRSQGMPVHLTFSCLDPVAGRHCGVCNKCAERRLGFRDAGRRDITPYAR